MIVTQDAFEALYAARSGISLEYFRSCRIALPCGCGEPECEGWAAVARTPRAICEYLDSYSPGATRGALYREALKMLKAEIDARAPQGEAGNESAYPAGGR